MNRKTIAALFAPLMLASCGDPEIPSAPVPICEGPGGRAEYTSRDSGSSSVATVSFFDAGGQKLPNDTTIFYGDNVYKMRSGGFTVAVQHCAGLPNPAPRG